MNSILIGRIAWCIWITLSCLRTVGVWISFCNISNMKLNASKCHFLQEKATIRGHVMSHKGVSTDPEKVKVLLEFSTSNDVSSLTAFLSCTGCYRHFVPHFAEIASPLYNLEWERTIFQRTKVCQDAFDALKHHLQRG